MAKKKIGYGDFYCWNCGDRMEKDKQICPVCGVQYYAENKYGPLQALGAGGLGWFEQTNHPSFKAYKKKVKKVAGVWAIGLSIIIPTALVVSGQIDLDKMGILNILFVVTLFWIFALASSRYGKNKPDWEGIVENKEIRQKTRTKKDDDGRKYKESYTEYAVIIKRQNGQVSQLTWEDSSRIYDYYRIGDYLRYHGNKYLRCFEKYDKTLDPVLYCAACGNERDARDNFCGKCGTILLKGKLE